MNAAWGPTVIVLGSAALSILAGGLLSQEKTAQRQCIDVAISLSLKRGDSFQQTIGNLTFKVRPLKSTGWTYSLNDAKGRDFIYPVNPPLRFNGSQTLGAGYGDNAKQSLSRQRELRFFLDESDYDAFEPYLNHALWPYNAPDPDRAAEEYLNELDKLRTGLLRMTIVRSDVSTDDEVRSAELRVAFIVPRAFPLSSLSPRDAVCPEASLPINERLSARIPVAHPEKYRNVQDATNWNNPYLVITSDGFDLRFRGGQMHGPLSTLARTLVALPDAAWPYGRVLAASESGVRPTDTDDLIRKNKQAADRILRELGVAVDWWPSA